MDDKLRGIINIVKEVVKHGYGSVEVIVEHNKIVLVEKKEKIKV